jgi:hypothetical protein
VSKKIALTGQQTFRIVGDDVEVIVEAEFTGPPLVTGPAGAQQTTPPRLQLAGSML